MLTLPPAIMARLDPFAPVFSKRVWQHVLVLVTGAILTPGQRMVSSVLRVTGLSLVSLTLAIWMVRPRRGRGRVRTARLSRPPLG